MLLPFNRGRDGGAGNPDIEDEFRIAYLYRDLPSRKAVFSREVLLGIIQRFVLVDEVEQPDGRVKRTTIWPRYQQMDAVHALVQDAKERGAGQSYLFHHSAGSGKSNTIAWAAHHLATLHDDQDQPVFDTIIIVTDRALSPIDRFGANPYTEEEQATLSEIINSFNQRHGTNFTDEDYIRFEAVNTAIVDDDAWSEMLRNNPPHDVRPRFDAEFMRRSIQAFQRDNAMRNAFMQDQEPRKMLMALMFQRAVRAAGDPAGR